MSTTVTQRPASPPQQPPSAPPSRSRYQRWLASWRVSLKMARRDARRFKGRSALVVVMVALPVALIVSGLSFAASSVRSLEERLPWLMGSGQAFIHSISAEKVTQGIDGQSQWSVDPASPEARKATAIPGMREDGTLRERTAALSALIPGTVLPIQTGEFRWVDGTTSPRAYALYFDTRTDLGAKARLTSGRWPTSNQEAVVTPAGVHEGLPSTGTVQIRMGERTATVTITGTADVFDADLGMPALVSTAPFLDDENAVWGTSWIVVRDQPVTWPQVRELNEYGLAVTSRYVVQHPPAAADLPASYDAQGDFDNQARVMAAMFGAVLFLVTALLVGPAFAVSAGRQRRSLALAASNGAEVRQLRRSVLSGAVILGCLAALIGAAAGAAGTAAGVALWHHLRPWSTIFGPFQAPVLPVAIVVACAVLAAITAALIPALRLGRLDIVGVMKGQNVSPPLNRILPLVGLVLFALGALGVFIAVTTTSITAGVGGVFGLVIGAIALIPLLLVWAGRLAGRFPVGIRMATRDAARQRHRAAPTVAALMAGSALLATFAIALESNTRFEASHYEPDNVVGEGRMWIDPKDQVPLGEQLKALVPTWRLVPYRFVGAEWVGTQEPASEPWVSVVPPGCSIADATPALSFPTDGSEVQPTPCRAVSSRMWSAQQHSEITVMPAAEMVRRYRLDAATAAAVTQGAVLVHDPKLISGGEVRLLIGQLKTTPDTGEASPIGEPKEIRVPARTLPEGLAAGTVPIRIGLVLSSEMTERYDIATTVSDIHVYDTRGAISRADQNKVSDTLGEEGMTSVERGYERPDKWLMLGVLAISGLLLVVVTLISTALALAEQQADMGTLAAVGATKGTRRRFAAAQAATVAIIGGLLGIAIGLVAGVAIAYPTTTTYWDQSGIMHTVAPTVGIPLIPIAMILLGVPVVAALIAAASIRRAPHVTRRGN